MSARCGAAAVLAALVVVAVPGAAQQMSDGELRERTMQYLNRVLDPAPGSQDLLRLFEQKVRAECELVAAATHEGIQKEEAWLAGLMRDAEIRVRRAAKSLSYSGALVARDPSDHAADREYRQALQELSNARLQLSVVASLNARVGACIESHREWLGRGKLVLLGTWRADTCSADPGITPDTFGRLRIEFIADTKVEGIVFPAEGDVGVDVAGTANEDRAFVLETKSGREPVIRVSGRIDSPFPLHGSGRISLRRGTQGQGAWSCSGTWESY